MTSYIIAVCPECKHYCVPLVAEIDADPPHCVNCYRLNHRGHIVQGGIKIGDLNKQPKMRMVEVIPKEAPFKMRKKVRTA